MSAFVARLFSGTSPSSETTQPSFPSTPKAGDVKTTIGVTPSVQSSLTDAVPDELKDPKPTVETKQDSQFFAVSWDLNGNRTSYKNPEELRTAIVKQCPSSIEFDGPSVAEKFMRGLEIAGLNTCECRTCVERRATQSEQTTTQPEQKNETTQPGQSTPGQPTPEQKNETTQPPSSENYNGADAISRLLNIVAAPYAKYSDSYQYTSPVMRNIPLMRPHIRMSVEKGEAGMSASFKALTKSYVKSMCRVDDDLDKFFDMDLVESLIQTTGKKTVLARVRFMPDSRILADKKHKFKSVYAPALLSTFKGYIENIYNTQDSIRFHSDNLGYDVYGDILAIARS